MMATAYLSRGVIKIPVVKSNTSWKTRSSLSCASPRNTPTAPHKEDPATAEAVCVIERWWGSVRNKRLFKLLKEAICAAEHSLTVEILRKVSPLEAELLKDPTIHATVKFRFGGSVFPPSILFKIFTATSGRVHYICGKKMIRPASEASADACRQMGNRKFYDQMLLDACQHQQLKITDEVDVTTMQEYMQYVANMDESPAYMGGKENQWRKLNLDILPRHSFLYNIVEFLTRAHLPGGMSLERMQSLSRPLTQTEQIEYIKAVSSISSQRFSPTKPLPPTMESRVPSRRTRQAQQRVQRMRRAYGIKSPERTGGDEGRPESEHKEAGSPTQLEAENGDEVEEEWEREASELYQWTQQLSFDDIR